jgi:hypothetical protein
LVNSVVPSPLVLREVPFVLVYTVDPSAAPVTMTVPSEFVVVTVPSALLTTVGGLFSSPSADAPCFAASALALSAAILS